MEIVASGCLLTNKQKEKFIEWLRKLPVLMKVSDKESLWEDCQGKQTIIWTKRSGFILY